MGKIGERLGLAPATLSFHLKELARADLVTTRPEGRFIYCSANFATMNGLVAYLTDNCCGVHRPTCLSANLWPASHPGRSHETLSRAHCREARRQYPVLCVPVWRCPDVVQPDYAKWMLEDPRKFCDLPAEASPASITWVFRWRAMPNCKPCAGNWQRQIQAWSNKPGLPVAMPSDKYWVTDPQGVAWETFHTLDTIPMYGEDTRTSAMQSACCIPLPQFEGQSESSACCIPLAESTASGPDKACCA